jgi:hypothetical protein
MTRRSKIWLGAAVAFVAINLAGAVFAAVAGELLHTGAHVALLVPGTWLVARLARGRRRDVEDVGVAEPDDFTDRLKNLEQSVDAVAIEIERIGEGQRFMTRVFADRGAQPLPEAEVAQAAPEAEEATPQSPRDSTS